MPIYYKLSTFDSRHDCLIFNVRIHASIVLMYALFEDDIYVTDKYPAVGQSWPDTKWYLV